MLLAAAGRRLGVADRLAGLIADPRDPVFVTHSPDWIGCRTERAWRVAAWLATMFIIRAAQPTSWCATAVPTFCKQAGFAP